MKKRTQFYSTTMTRYVSYLVMGPFEKTNPN